MDEIKGEIVQKKHINLIGCRDIIVILLITMLLINDCRLKGEDLCQCSLSHQN